MMVLKVYGLPAGSVTGRLQGQQELLPAGRAAEPAGFPAAADNTVAGNQDGMPVPLQSLPHRPAAPGGAHFFRRLAVAEKHAVGDGPDQAQQAASKIAVAAFVQG